MNTRLPFLRKKQLSLWEVLGVIITGSVLIVCLYHKPLLTLISLFVGVYIFGGKHNLEDLHKHREFLHKEVMRLQKENQSLQQEEEIPQDKK